MILALAVVLANGRPLLYFDSASYLDQGARAIGLAPEPQVDSPDAPPDAVSRPAPAAGPDTVAGNRSFIYSLFVAGLFGVAGLSGVVLANLAAVTLAALLVARRLAPDGPFPGAMRLAAVGLIAASLGSLPFYVAFVMPDIFAPVLILMIALVFAYAPRMDRTELTAAVLLALFAIVVHPSHLLVALGLTPVALVLSPMGGRRRFGLLLALAALLVTAGVAERLLFRMAVERVLHRQVVDLPFLTARLIDDGPGLAYLQERCPDANYPTCALQAVLARSDDPRRLDAPNILFSQAGDRGSYKLLDPDMQRAVALDQLAFVRDVVARYPGRVALAVGRNILTQLAYSSVEMTVPTDSVAEAIPKLTRRLDAQAATGRVRDAFGAVRLPLYLFHGAVYLLSALVLAGLAVSRRGNRSQVSLILIVLAGIVVNAAVCGAVSEPAHRYGARVMFLLPMLAAMLWFTPPRSPQAARPARPASARRPSARHRPDASPDSP